MIAEEQERVSNPQKRPSPSHKVLSWINIAIGLALLVWGVWYVAAHITLAEIGRALALADPFFIGLALAIFILTLLAKAWRWQLQFAPRIAQPPFAAAFWALMLGQFVNTAVSFMRLGDLARVYALFQQTGISKMESLGTLVLEKTLDLLMLALTLVLILPFVIVPDFIAEQGVILGLAALLVFAILYLVAYQTYWVLRLVEVLVRSLPARLNGRLLQFATSGLAGLAAMRSKKTLLGLLARSVLIAALSVLMPYTLFYAFHLPFGLSEAVLINLGVSVAAAVPVPTPAKIGIFEFAVVFVMRQFGYTDEAVALSYALVFHLLILLPQIVLGVIAAWRTDWRWSKTAVLSKELRQTPPP
ncbi:MAG: flippase-like domain-containing protein [Ardenticatenaceae bacterium]|nr:flippase-like domain-containing protein [Ardenticatenaceae bacterium]